MLPNNQWQGKAQKALPQVAQAKEKIESVISEYRNEINFERNGMSLREMYFKTGGNLTEPDFKSAVESMERSGDVELIKPEGFQNDWITWRIKSKLPIPTSPVKPSEPLTTTGNMKKAYDALSGLREYGDGVVPLPRMFHQMRASQPGLTVKDFHAELGKLRDQKEFRMIVLNEVREAKEPELGMRQGDNLYYFIQKVDPEKTRAADRKARSSESEFRIGVLDLANKIREKGSFESVRSQIESMAESVPWKQLREVASHFGAVAVHTKPSEYLTDILESVSGVSPIPYDRAQVDALLKKATDAYNSTQNVRRLPGGGAVVENERMIPEVVKELRKASVGDLYQVAKRFGLSNVKRDKSQIVERIETKLRATSTNKSANFV